MDSDFRVRTRELAKIIADTEWRSRGILPVSIFAVACAFIPGAGGVGALAQQLGASAADADLRTKIESLARLLVAHDERLASLNDVEEMLDRIARALPTLDDFSSICEAALRAAAVLKVSASEEGTTNFVQVRIENLRLEVHAESGAKVVLDEVEQDGPGAAFSNQGGTMSVQNSKFTGPNSSVAASHVEIQRADVAFNTGRAAAEVSSGMGTAGIVITPGGVVFGAEIEGDNPYNIQIKPKG